MIFQNGIVPLDCNRAGYDRWKAREASHLGNTPEARIQQKRVASYLDKQRAIGTHEHMAALKKFGGSIISKNIQLMLFTQSIITSMFKIVTVEGTNVPAYHLKTIPEIDVWQMSGHGYPNSVIKLSSIEQFFPTPYQISTDRIYQYMPSVLTGNPEPDDDINQRAQYEIDQRIEDDLWDLLTAAVGAFTNAWVYDNRIQDMPTTNELDLSAEGGITVKWMRQLLAAVDKIPARNGSGIATSQAVKIRNLIIPSSSAQDIRLWVSVVSSVAGGDVSQDAADSVSAEKHAELERTGMTAIQTMWGEPINLIKSKRLMGTSAADWEKYAWAIFNQPIGRLIHWPAESKRITYDDRLQNNQEGMSIHETIAMEIPSPWAPNFMQVKIKT